MGFCVARMKNGSPSACRTRPTVTCRSCMASSRAACVLGGVRLTSSARITLENSGPSRKRNSRLPVVRFSTITSVPVMSAGVRSGVNWMRLKLRFERAAQGADHQRLGQARHAFQQAMPAAEEADQQFFDDRRLADDDLAQLVHDLAAGGVEFLDGGGICWCADGSGVDR